MDGDVSRLRLLPCTGSRSRYRCRRQAAFFADACRLAREPAQEIQLGPAYPAFPHQPDLGDRRRVQREDPLDAHARGNLADGEGLVHAAAPPGDTNPLERLQALFLTSRTRTMTRTVSPGAKAGMLSRKFSITTCSSRRSFPIN